MDFKLLTTNGGYSGDTAPHSAHIDPPGVLVSKNEVG